MIRAIVWPDCCVFVAIMRQTVINPPINTGRQYTRATARDARVRRLTFWSVIVLCGLCAGAVWQDRALAPPLHDGMRDAVAVAARHVAENEALATALDALRQEYVKLTSDG